jgi:glucose-6-phosphate isomerase
MVDVQLKNALFTTAQMEKAARKLDKELEHLRAVAKSNDFSDVRASINLPTQSQYQKAVKKLVTEKKKLNIDILVICGIGGSNLGIIAIQEAILGKLHNMDQKPQVLYADTVDSDWTGAILQYCEHALKDGKNVLVNCITKSGSTTETIGNFHLFYALLKKYRRNYTDYIVCTTDKGSKLWNVAFNQDLAMLEIPKNVGGRYSVMSAVGMFPLALLGINTAKLLKGAARMKKECLKKKIDKNPAAMMATLAFLHQEKGVRINDLFLFSVNLESIGKWYRQLMGESIGKEHNVQNKKVLAGITPTVSIGSTDLHSMAQLYLGGPYDKYTTFITVKKNLRRLKVPKIPELSSLVDHVQGKSYDALMDAILQGVQIAFTKSKRPFIELSLDRRSEEEIGALLQLFMIQMILLGTLMNVNPFDQPAVEKYKKETRQLLQQ